MGISVQWDNPEKTIVRWDYDPGWSWDDFFTAQKQIEALVDSVGHRVDMILDVRNSPDVPQDMPDHFHGMTPTRLRRRVMIIVGANSAMEAMLGAYAKYQPGAGKGIVVADTLEKARAMIANLRETGGEL